MISQPIAAQSFGFTDPIGHVTTPRADSSAYRQHRLPAAVSQLTNVRLPYHQHHLTPVPPLPSAELSQLTDVHLLTQRGVPGPNAAHAVLQSSLREQNRQRHTSAICTAESRCKPGILRCGDTVSQRHISDIYTAGQRHTSAIYTAESRRQPGILHCGDTGTYNCNLDIQLS